MFWLTVTTLGGFTRVLRQNRDLLGFGGVWALGALLGPNRQKIFDPKKSKKNFEDFIFRCGSKKCVFVKNGAIFFRFRPLVSPIGAVRTEKTYPFQGQFFFGPDKNRKPC